MVKVKMYKRCIIDIIDGDSNWGNILLFCCLPDKEFAYKVLQIFDLKLVSFKKEFMIRNTDYDYD